MDSLKNSKLMLVVIVLFISTTCAYCYPPDNAAVLYYKAAICYSMDEEMKEMLGDLQKGEVEVNDKIRGFVKRNRRSIDMVLDAAEIPNCDWGIDFSKGMDALMPPMSDFRRLVYLVIADARILAADGRYGSAISRCMSLYRMARHINNRVYVNYLVGISINGITNRCLNHIMAEMPQHARNMTRLKTDLAKIESIPLSIKPAILGELECCLSAMTLEKMPEVAEISDCNEATAKRLLSLDEAAIERNREYYKNYIATLNTAYDMPYVQGYAAMKELHNKLKEDVKSDPDLFLTEYLTPATDRIFSLLTRFKTHNNAIKAAIELYLVKAKTGKLPDSLPAGMPKDLFSGKDFEYENTADGFILRCQGKDLSKDEIYEYEFKVKK